RVLRAAAGGRGGPHLPGRGQGSRQTVRRTLPTAAVRPRLHARRSGHTSADRTGCRDRGRGGGAVARERAMARKLAEDAGRTDHTDAGRAVAGEVPDLLRRAPALQRTRDPTDRGPARAAGAFDARRHDRLRTREAPTRLLLT